MLRAELNTRSQKVDKQKYPVLLRDTEKKSRRFLSVEEAQELLFDLARAIVAALQRNSVPANGVARSLNSLLVEMMSVGRQIELKRCTYCEVFYAESTICSVCQSRPRQELQKLRIETLNWNLRMAEHEIAHLNLKKCPVCAKYENADHAHPETQLIL